MAPGSMLSIRSPMTRSAPLSSFFTNREMSLEVVGEIRVSHHDVGSAGGPEAGQVRAAVSPAMLENHAGTRYSASSALRSDESLSTTITSPARPSSSSASQAAERTHSVMLSSSFRQGITTETIGVTTSFSGDYDCSTHVLNGVVVRAAPRARSRRILVHNSVAERRWQMAETPLD